MSIVSNQSILRRFAVPLTILFVVMVVFAVNSQVELMPKFGRSGTIVIYQYLSLLALVLLGAWFFLSRQFQFVTKGVVALALVAIVGTIAGAVRKVEINGDNIPILYFRWEDAPGSVDLASRSPSSTIANFQLVPDAPSCPGFLGPKRDGHVPGPSLARDWKQSPPKQLWRKKVGAGYSAFAVAQGLAVTLEQRGSEEALVAYDVRTGSEVWSRRWPGLFHEAMGGDGPRATPTIDGDRLYSLGATGLLFCHNLATGEEIWNVNILDDNGATNVQWGMCGSPWVEADRVVVNPGGPNGRALVAYDKKSGKRILAGGSTTAAYSSPISATVTGVDQYLLLDSAGLAGYDRSKLEVLWSFPFTTFQDINASQPLVIGPDLVLISSGYGTGSALLKITQREGAWSAQPLWKNKKLKCKFCSPILINGFVYGLDDGILACIDPTSGNQQWKVGRYGHGQILYRGDIIIVMAEDGAIVLCEANPKKHVELTRVQALPGLKTWNAPALAGNLAVVRNHFEAACYELPLANTEPSRPQHQQ